VRHATSALIADSAAATSIDSLNPARNTSRTAASI
jgi:hypothetical protein